MTVDDGARAMVAAGSGLRFLDAERFVFPAGAPETRFHVAKQTGITGTSGKFPCDSSSVFDVSPGGAHVAAFTGNDFEVLDSTTWRSVASFPDAPAPGRARWSKLAVAYSRDGRHLAASTWNGTVVVFHSDTWKEAKVWKPNGDDVSATLGFSRDSKHLITAGRDQTMRAWRSTDWTEVSDVDLKGAARPIEASPVDDLLLVGWAASWDTFGFSRLLIYRLRQP